MDDVFTREDAGGYLLPAPSDSTETAVTKLNLRLDEVFECLSGVREAADGLLGNSSSGGSTAGQQRDFGTAIGDALVTGSGCSRPLTAEDAAYLQALEERGRPRMKRITARDRAITEAALRLFGG
jgi:hypothetical protein